MEQVVVRGSRSFRYPFSQEVFEDRSVIYHGTCSAFSEHIERFGFQRGTLPFDWSMIKRVVSVCHEVSFRPMELTFIALGTERHTATSAHEWNIYFGGTFWEALNYSRSLGGETIQNTIAVAAKFTKMASNPELLDKHASALQRAFPGQVEGWTAKLRDRSLMARLAGELATIRQELQAVIRDAVPIVYAVSVEPSWFKRPWDAGERPFNAACNTSILPDRIVGRAIYLDGIEHDSPNYRHVNTWEEVVHIK
jgi:hypothetical protein